MAPKLFGVFSFTMVKIFVIVKQKGANMKTKETKKMPLRQKFHNFCADVSTRVLFGGGAV